LIDILISNINNGMDTIKNEKVKEKISDTISFLEKMRKDEKDDDKNDLLKAEEMLIGIN
jgi:hypothetical protein